MNASVALNFFPWDNSIDTSLRFWKRYTKSYFINHAPFTIFTSAPSSNVVSKRKSLSRSSTKYYKTKRSNVIWHTYSKVIEVEVWLHKIKKFNFHATTKQASSYVVPTVLNMHQHHPSVFLGLKQDHLRSWIQKHVNWSCNIDVITCNGRIMSNSSDSHAIIVPLILLKEIDALSMTLIASKCELNAVLLRPFIIKFVKTIDDGVNYYLIDNDSFK